MLCKLHWAVCILQDWANNIQLIPLLLPAQETKAFSKREISNIAYCDSIYIFCPKTVFQNTDEKQTNTNRSTIRTITVNHGQAPLYFITSIKNPNPKQGMPPSDLPDRAEILEREALFENHIFVQGKKKKRNCKEMLAERLMHYQDAF